jgi:hypothetical protein
MGNRMRYWPLIAVAFVAGLGVIWLCPPEGVLPAAVLLCLAGIITRERRRLDQPGLFQLYATSLIVVMLAIAGLVVALPRSGPTECGLIAATAATFAPLILCACRDLDPPGRRKLIAIGIAAAVAIAAGTLVFAPAIY